MSNEGICFFFLFVTGKASAAEAYWLVYSRMELCNKQVNTLVVDSI